MQKSRVFLKNFQSKDWNNNLQQKQKTTVEFIFCEKLPKIIFFFEKSPNALGQIKAVVCYNSKNANGLLNEQAIRRGN